MASTKNANLLVKKPTPRAIVFQNVKAGIYLKEAEKKYDYQSSSPISRYVVTEHYSMTPCSVVIYNRFHKREISKVELDKKAGELEIAAPEVDVNSSENKERNSVAHNFELSKQARKNLRSKVTWLYYFAKKQIIHTKKGKTLSNFKMNFITLKLPSVQIDSSDFITKNCLNQLLTEISKKYKFDNYVWRLEYQKNGNLHYHIATDTYIDYYFLIKTWNRILNKYGYVDVFKRKFSQLSLADYIKEVSSATNNDYAVHQERYAKGCREKWNNPNTVDVKAVFGKSNIAFYISKYMAKKPEEGQVITLPVCELNSANSRLWFCSRSLSKCKTVSDFREVEEIDFYSMLNGLEKVRKVICDYCTILYFQIDELPAIVQSVLRKRFGLYREEIGYDIAV